MVDLAGHEHVPGFHEHVPGFHGARSWTVRRSSGAAAPEEG